MRAPVFSAMVFQTTLLPVLLLNFVVPSDAVVRSAHDLTDLVLAQAESVRALERLQVSVKNYTNVLQSILDEWRGADYESVLPPDSPSHFRKLSEKRYLLKYENEAPQFYRARIALSVRLAYKAYAERDNPERLTGAALARKQKLEQYQRDGGGALHPIDAYLFIKRCTSTFSSALNSLNSIIDVLEGTMHNLKLLRKSMGVTEKDLSAAAEAILHLQETKHLNTSQLAEGSIPANPTHARSRQHLSHGAGSAGRLDLWDRLQVAQAALRTTRPELARSWYESAVSLLQGQTPPPEVLRLKQQILIVPRGDQAYLETVT